MKSESKIYVAGHKGLVGSSLVKYLKEKGYSNIIVSDHADLDLRDIEKTNEFFKKEKPEYVFLAAAKVGGVLANETYPATLIYDNLMIESSVINAAYKNGVKKLLFMASACIYPENAPQPRKESFFFQGSPTKAHAPYALAKIAGIMMCQAYNRQYGTNYISIVPSNLYGENDNFDLETSHVLPALVRKFHEAKASGKRAVEVWGNGEQEREFLYVMDLSRACEFLMNNYNENNVVNIGTGKGVKIKELASIISDVVGYNGEILFNENKPIGIKSMINDVSYINSLGWKASTELKIGIEKTYKSFLKNEINIRRF